MRATLQSTDNVHYNVQRKGNLSPYKHYYTSEISLLINTRQQVEEKG